MSIFPDFPKEKTSVNHAVLCWEFNNTKDPEDQTVSITVRGLFDRDLRITDHFADAQKYNETRSFKVDLVTVFSMGPSEFFKLRNVEFCKEKGFQNPSPEVNFVASISHELSMGIYMDLSLTTELCVPRTLELLEV